MNHSDIIKVNLGCGPSGINWWVNFDWGILPLLSKIKWLRKIVINLGMLSKCYDIDWADINLVNITRRLPLKDNSVDYVYCSHVLEHFDKKTAILILKDISRVLKKRGVVRIVLPDLKLLIDQYKSADEFNRDYFGYDKDKYDWKRIFIRGHEWMYDKKSAFQLLSGVFGKVVMSEYKDGNFPDIEQLDLQEHSNHSLYIEGVK